MFVASSIFVEHCTMAFGDPIEEGACLLPGGSRVEALDIENLSSRPTRRLVIFLYQMMYFLSGWLLARNVFVSERKVILVLT